MEELLKEKAGTVQEAPDTVAIISGEAVAGRALELLLRSVGYETKFLVEPHLDDMSQLLDGVQILILAPTVNEKYKEDLMRIMDDMPAKMKKPVLELVTSQDAPPSLTQGRVLWPCRIEELQREIETALLIGSKSETSSKVESDTNSMGFISDARMNTKTA